MEFILQVGADVEEMPGQLGDICEPGPFTALYKAVQGQHVEIIKLLLEHGATVDLRRKHHCKRQTTEQQQNSKSS